MVTFETYTRAALSTFVVLEELLPELLELLLVVSAAKAVDTIRSTRMKLTRQDCIFMFSPF